MIAADERAGFPGIGDHAELLIEYEERRKVYPTMEEFIPRIVSYFDQYAESFK